MKDKMNMFETVDYPIFIPADIAEYKATGIMTKIRFPMIRGVLDYREFYGKPVPEGIFSNLEKYPTDILIAILVRINALIFQCGNNINQIDNGVFKLVFNKLDQSIFKRINAIRNTDRGSHGAIFTPQPLVGLMGKLITHYHSSTDQFLTDEAGVKQMMKELFDAILGANDSYYNDVDSDNMFSKEHLWKLGLLQQEFARAYHNMFGVIPIKIFMFYRFMSERYGGKVLQEFATAFNVTTAYNFYFVFLGTIADAANQFESDGQPRFYIQDKRLQKVMEPFVFDPTKPQQSSFTGESFALINQPFYRLFEGIAVLDFSFFAHLTDISLIYHFYHTTSLKQQHGIKDYNEYQGIIGKHFYEEYLMVQLFRKLFPHRYDTIYTDKDDPLYPDILVLQNKTDVFVIEIKSTRVHGKVLDQADITGFENFLLEKFCSEKTVTGGKNKGIHQLKKQIQHLKQKKKSYRIFPVIVYTEPSMDIPGVNSFLDEKFDAVIEEDRSDFKKVYPLTLINVDFFIKFFPQMKKERYFLRDKIVEYHQQKRRQIKAALKESNSFSYLRAEYSFIRMMEQTYSPVDPMLYFKPVADELGFRDEAKNALFN